MAISITNRVTAVLAMTGAVLALIGNALAPRINGDDVDVYRKVATSDRYAVAAVIVLVALILVIAAFVGLSRTLGVGRLRDLGEYARLAAAVGGAVALVQGGIELYGYRQQAKAFDGANAHNVVSAFWATNALDHANSGMFAIWTIVLLGLAPLLLGAAQWKSASGARLGTAAMIGGAVCVVVGIGELLTADQSRYDIPFAIGSVIVTIWLLVTGVTMWRRPEHGEIDIAQPRSATAEEMTARAPR